MIKTNAIQTVGGQGRTPTLGRALFPTFSFLSHSCVTNSRHIIEQDLENPGKFKISIYSQIPIKQNEEITITYTSLLRPLLERREKLEYLWHFTCQCLRCQDPTEFGTFLGKWEWQGLTPSLALLTHTLIF